MERAQDIILRTLDRLEEKMEYFGRTIVQKAFYFLVEVAGVELPFSFSFYHYGPYSFELQNMLDKLEVYGLISVESDPQQVGYRYMLTDQGRELARSEKPDTALGERIECVTDFVKNKQPRDLELLSTIHFAQKVHTPADDIALTDIVKFLKPKFDTDTIQEKIRFLREKKMLPPGPE